MTDLLAAEALGIAVIAAACAWRAWQKRIRRTVQHQRDLDLATCQAIWDASIDA